MFKSLLIDNFKGFSKPQKVKLAPITLIYGPNSSGKSSIIQALMLLKQTIIRPTESGGLTSTGEYVDLGAYSSMVNGHDVAKDINFAVEYAPYRAGLQNGGANSLYGHMFGSGRSRTHHLTYSLSGHDCKNKNEAFSYLKRIHTIISNEHDNKPLIDVDLTSELNDLSKGSYSERYSRSAVYRYTSEESRDSVTNFVARRIGVEGFKANPIIKTIDVMKYRRELNFSTPSAIELSDYKTADGLTMAFSNDIIGDISKELQDKFGTISYLGPLRIHPARLYAPKGDHSGSVGKSGENAARLIYEKSPEISKSINDWFRQFEIPYELSAHDIGNDVTGSVISLQLKDQRTGVTVGPSDVGFGIGQMLPILVEGVVRKESTICVEQPEIHLHPRLQAHLANFMIETSRRNKDATRPANQWIVETHSESLILRIQKKIKEKELDPQDVSIIYVEATSKGSRILEIPMDKDGDFMVDWPDGFFDERFKEVFGF
jgi:AAA15 family ATPase/GTPase